MKALSFVLLFLTASALAIDGVPVGWGASAMTEDELLKQVFPHQGRECPWVGCPANAFQQEKIYAHKGPVAFHTHFPLAFPDGSKPLLLINGLADGSSAQLNGKPIALVKERPKGSDAFAKERWFLLPPEVLRKHPAHNCLVIWSSSIRKEKDGTVAPVSVIVFEDPDVMAERERQKRLRAPYLREETEDPYVARHW
jgi:hypothetical protein